MQNDNGYVTPEPGEEWASACYKSRFVILRPAKRYMHHWICMYLIDGKEYRLSFSPGHQWVKVDG